MGTSKDKQKRGLICMALKRCRSLGHQTQKSNTPPRSPKGYFTVYVGPEKERFVVKMESANHPLFKLLLDEAETEYGFSSKGPLELPCDVDSFHQVLWEMEHEMVDAPRCSFAASPMCSFAKSPSRYRILSPSSLV